MGGRSLFRTVLQGLKTSLDLGYSWLLLHTLQGEARDTQQDITTCIMQGDGCGHPILSMDGADQCIMLTAMAK